MLDKLYLSQLSVKRCHFFVSDLHKQSLEETKLSDSSKEYNNIVLSKCTKPGRVHQLCKARIKFVAYCTFFETNGFIPVGIELH